MNATTDNAVDRLLELARGIVRDLHPGTPDLVVTLDSRLDRDLGLDSLARVELFARIEAELGVQLPSSLLESANTLRDVAACLGVSPTAQAAPAHAPPPCSDAERASPAPSQLATLTQVLHWHAEHQGGFVHLELLSEQPEAPLTYADLLSDAQRVAGALQHLGIQKGDRVALMLPTCRTYFAAFMGAVIAGAVPVPLYPPARAAQLEEHVHRHAGILVNAGATVLIAGHPLHAVARILKMHAPCVRRAIAPEELLAMNAATHPVDARPDDLALLQYTSGSTGQPKGVALTHDNVLSNLRALGRALHVCRDDVFVSWLPLYHDMGLIGAWLGTLYFGVALKLMSPLRFLARPVRWLEGIHAHRGTISAAPNFAYELCLKHATDSDLARLDLSSWRLALNGAEPVLPETLERFQARFARCGLKASALTPVYGLAENTVGLTIPPLGRAPRIDSIERDTFTRHGRAVPAGAGAVRPLRFASCGVPLDGHEVRIVDDDGRELAERHEGRLQFRGPSATAGYFRNPQANAALFHDGWLDSGDRAYIAAGEVYPTGRVKDIIIRAGRHIYPEELEAAIGAVAGVRKGCIAVFGSKDVHRGTERVVVLAETHVGDRAQQNALRDAIAARALQTLGEPVDLIVLCPPHTVLKTSSGKIRRDATRRLFESGRHRLPQRRAPWLQVLRLTLGGLAPGLRRLRLHAAALAYAGYFWLLLGLIGFAAYCALLLPLTSEARWRIVRRSARAFFRAVRVPIETTGNLAVLDSTRAHVIVANHASYLDALLLATALPRACSFVAKAELAHIPLVAGFLRRLNTLFVERFAALASVADAERIVEAVEAGRSCVFFPEGTFTRLPGLRPFHLGAFVTAVAAGVDVVPVAMVGSRSLLRDEQWIPTRGPIKLIVGDPLRCSTPDAFRAAVALRDAARTWILGRCGEPDLARGGVGTRAEERLASLP